MRSAEAPASPVRVALVGCGTVARRYYAPTLANLQAEGRVSTGCLYDVDPSRAKHVAGLLSESTAAPSWETVLEDPAELTIVASPPVAHAEQVRALLEHGKHVLCEKPFTLERAAAAGLADLARERGLVCAAGMVRRFSRSACLLRRLLAEERPTRLVWHEGGPFRWPVDSPGYFAPAAGNRLLWDVGSHVLDLLAWWLGPPGVVACRDDAMGGTATNCLLELAWPDGCSGEVRLSREYEFPVGLVIEGPSRRLACRDVTELDVLTETGEPVDPEFEQPIPGAGASAGRTFHDSFELQLRNVLAALRGDGVLWVRPEDVLDGIGALEEAEATSQLLESPWFASQDLNRARAFRSGAPEAARC